MKILHIDDHVLFMDGMGWVLKNLSPDVEIYQSTHCHQALRIAAENPDIALTLLDLRMPGVDGHACLKAFCEQHPDLSVVILSASEDVDDVRLALEQGASGFIPKSAPAPVLLSAIQLVLAGGIYIPPLILAAVAGTDMAVNRVPHPAENAVHMPNLTERQKQVLGLLVQGKVNKLIARELGISEGTVKIHLASIYEALSVKNRTEAVITAQQMGFVPAAG